MEIKMHYVCIENGVVVSVLNYLPSVPTTVEVVEITDAQFQGIQDQTHYFDLEEKVVKTVSQTELDKKELEKSNIIDRAFLSSTDWMVLRHIRQKFLGIETSLTEEQYKDLEEKRQAAASRIL